MTATILFFLNEQIVPFELDAFTFIFTFAYFELHMLSQKLNQRKPQEEGVEHQNQFDACFLQLLLLWPINHGQPLPAQRVQAVVVTWPKSNSYQIFGGSDYCYVLLLWTTWWRVVRELEKRKNILTNITHLPIIRLPNMAHKEKWEHLSAPN